MADSFLKTIDFGLRALLYTKYHDLLNLESIDKGVILYPKEIALRKMAEKRSKVELEFINLWKTRVAFDWKRNRTPVARRGMALGYVNDATQRDATIYKSVPVDLEYDVWFWTHDPERLNNIAERYLFWQQDNPNLSILVDEVYEMDLDLHFSELIDESTIREQYTKGKIYVSKTHIKLDGWVFTSTTVKAIETIVLTMYDKDEVETYSEIIVEDSNQDTELETTLKLFEKRIDFTV